MNASQDHTDDSIINSQQAVMATSNMGLLLSRELVIITATCYRPKKQLAHCATNHIQHKHLTLSDLTPPVICQRKPFCAITQIVPLAIIVSVYCQTVAAVHCKMLSQVTSITISHQTACNHFGHVVVCECMSC